MQAVVLAAGYGRRMGRRSESQHKALLSIAGTTILERIMEGLRAIEVSHVTVVVGYRGHDIESFLTSRYRDMNLQFVRNERFPETNNIVSLSLALDGLAYEEDVVLIECDLLFEPSLLTRLVGHPAANVALVDRYRPGMDGTVVSLSGGIVTGVYPPDQQNADFNYSDKFKTLNIYRFHRDFCRDRLRPLLNCYANLDPTCYYEVVLSMLANLPQYQIAAELVGEERWVEIDDPNDFAVAQFEFEPAKRAEVIDKSFGGLWNYSVIDFAFMRNAYFPTEAMIAAMRHALGDLLRGYGSSQAVLNEKLSYVLRCDPSRIQVIHGATQAFPILHQIWWHKDIGIPTPTFGEYARSFAKAKTYIDRPGIDWNEVDCLATEVEILVIVSPNNPTGTTAPASRVHELARRHPATTFLVDESFVAFTGDSSVMEILEREPLANVVVLASLSKSLGVPGLRLGYVYTASQTFLQLFEQQLPIWNLSSPAEFFLELALKFQPQLRASVERTIDDREVLRAALSHLPVVAEVYPSGGNFVLIRTAGEDAASAAVIRNTLLDKTRIHVKDVSSRFPDDKPRIRLGLRTSEENALLLEALSGLGQAGVT